MDIDAAVSDIGSTLFDDGDLGSGATPDNDSGDDLGLGGDAEPSPAPAPAPATAPTPAPAPAPVAGTPAPAPAPTDPAATPAPGPGDLPKTWKQDPAIVEKWATTDPVIKAEIARREEAMFQGMEAYKGDASDGKIFQQVLKPYEHIFRQYNINPVPVVAGLLTAHHTLATGTPDQKVGYLRKLAQDYGIDLETAAAPAPYEDPEVARLREENQRLQSSHRETAQQAQTAFQTTLNMQLDAFESDPRHVHFKVVGHDMVPFINAGLSLEDAYQKAIWANPTTRALEITRQTAEATAKTAKEEADRVAAARRATGANVRTSARSGSATAPLGSMDDTMKETLERIKNR